MQEQINKYLDRFKVTNIQNKYKDREIGDLKGKEDKDVIGKNRSSPLFSNADQQQTRKSMLLSRDYYTALTLENKMLKQQNQSLHNKHKMLIQEKIKLIRCLDQSTAKIQHQYDQLIFVKKNLNQLMKRCSQKQNKQPSQSTLDLRNYLFQQNQMITNKPLKLQIQQLSTKLYQQQKQKQILQNQLNRVRKNVQTYQQNGIYQLNYNKQYNSINQDRQQVVWVNQIQKIKKQLTQQMKNVNHQLNSITKKQQNIMKEKIDFQKAKGQIQKKHHIQMAKLKQELSNVVIQLMTAKKQNDKIKQNRNKKEQSYNKLKQQNLQLTTSIEQLKSPNKDIFTQLNLKIFNQEIQSTFSFEQCKKRFAKHKIKEEQIYYVSNALIKFFNSHEKIIDNIKSVIKFLTVLFDMINKLQKIQGKKSNQLINNYNLKYTWRYLKNIIADYIQIKYKSK